jgi:hypothetical protein
MRGDARALEGIPTSVKNDDAIAERPVTAGSVLIKDNRATESTPVVDKLLAAGGCREIMLQGTSAPTHMQRDWRAKLDDLNPHDGTGDAGQHEQPAAVDDGVSGDAARPTLHGVVLQKNNSVSLPPRRCISSTISIHTMEPVTPASTNSPPPLTMVFLAMPPDLLCMGLFCKKAIPCPSPRDAKSILRCRRIYVSTMRRWRGRT